MKKRFILLLVSTLLSCASALEETPPVNLTGNAGLVGTWKLVEYLADPGNGRGTYQPVNGRFTEIVEFRADGRFIGTTDLGLSQAQRFEYYKVIDGQRIELIYKTNTANRPTQIWWYSDLTASTLTLSYGCIEPCRGKYVRVK